ncbi:multicopper oxidase family protein [Mechercharimyces sp. CAU 1602]|uniref:multicopper oxidase family protein n=1 Tax=Mechercharimyces sp. CAU 1602 TaxID=2973933 RepID=UPI0021622340|nr:multicopper oxidase [Mechercharimyces sp. CAU 1602]MCS1351746.1 multicopper oxidase [Mechercharimyces sp. CAU 1602]
MQLEKYRDALPIPPLARPIGTYNHLPYYEMKMTQFRQSLHSQLPSTMVWGFNGHYPGPTFDVCSGQPLYVSWCNQLPSNHLLPIDHSIQGANSCLPDVRTVTHLHGGINPTYYDGYPEAWFTRDFRERGPYFVSPLYFYRNEQPSATLWYHDHALAITRLNNYAGLSGLYIIRDPEEHRFHLPQSPYEIPLIIQDRSFQADGSLYYPNQPEYTQSDWPYPSVVRYFFGDTMLVNGKVWPYLSVEPRKYRFRILNGCNSRFLRLQLSSNQLFVQIGTDQGFLPHPITIRQLLLGPAERADIIIDFHTQAGESLLLKNNAPTPYPHGKPIEGDSTEHVMQFRVQETLEEEDISQIPPSLVPIKRLQPTPTTPIRLLSLDESKDHYGRPLMLLHHERWNDPVSICPQLGTQEVWNLINTTELSHPIHLHLVKFLILCRRSFDVERYQATGRIHFTQQSRPPSPSEAGWKDTVISPPGEVTSIISCFSPYTGRYVWHCHMLEHEDYEMMRPFLVIR